MNVPSEGEEGVRNELLFWFEKNDRVRSLAEKGTDWASRGRTRSNSMLSVCTVFSPLVLGTCSNYGTEN